MGLTKDRLTSGTGRAHAILQCPCAAFTSETIIQFARRVKARNRAVPLFSETFSMRWRLETGEDCVSRCAPSERGQWAMHATDIAESRRASATIGRTLNGDTMRSIGTLPRACDGRERRAHRCVRSRVRHGLHGVCEERARTETSVPNDGMADVGCAGTMHRDRCRTENSR
ncbi:hypothetical protein BHM03_00010830 [Ensete ventricosum]|uniref:Uncharacterized protein n=1 Tax=Ensete ventricosum TaxID=4639 RepID=A0A445MD39_ENSVE|nr:hypothetical protein BHM03_00010830 [Ensete ventricosum]